MTETTEKLINQFKKANLTQEDRAYLMSVILEKLSALPIQDIITIDAAGVPSIKGQELDPEQRIAFGESCISLKDNYARKVLREQIKYLAIKEGVHKGLTTEMILFSKAALWVLEQEDILLSKIFDNSN